MSDLFFLAVAGILLTTALCVRLALLLPAWHRDAQGRPGTGMKNKNLKNKKQEEEEEEESLIREGIPILRDVLGEKQKLEGEKGGSVSGGCCVHVKCLVVLGSGGHTSEMLRMVSGLDPERYKPLHFVIADTDKMSETKLNQMLQTVMGAADQGSESASSSCCSWNPCDIFIHRIPRSREVGQSFVSSFFSTLYAILYSVPLVTWTINPDLILVNGPGTCIPICGIGFVLRWWRWWRCALVINPQEERGQQKQKEEDNGGSTVPVWWLSKSNLAISLPIPFFSGSGRLLASTCSRFPQILFVESFCRVKTMSLSGRILYHTFADHILVQWERLKEEYPAVHYLGRLM